MPDPGPLQFPDDYREAGWMIMSSEGTWALTVHDCPLSPCITNMTFRLALLSG